MIPFSSVAFKQTGGDAGFIFVDPKAFDFGSKDDTREDAEVSWYQNQERLNEIGYYQNGYD